MMEVKILLVDVHPILRPDCVRRSPSNPIYQ